MDEFEGQTENAIGVSEASLRQPSIFHYITVIPTWLACLALFILMVMTFFDVVLRSTINNPIESGTELTRIFMATAVFASLPVVSWKGTHIIVDLMDPLFSRRLAHIRDIVIDLTCGIVLIWPAIRIWELAERAHMFGDVTEYIGIPQYLPNLFIAFFTSITAVVFIIRGVVRIIAPNKVPS